MKKITLILISIMLISSIGVAQTTLTASMNPVPGDVEAWAICDTTNITQGNSGANQTWNFTNLTTVDTAIVTYVASGSTPYAAQFPGSNIASTMDDSNYYYGTSSQNNFLLNGSGGPDIMLQYSDPQTYMEFPFGFGSSFSDNYAANYTIGSTPIIETGTTTVNGDAWGTINLPDGSHSNALRVKHILVTKDSSDFFVTVTTVTTYSWFVPGRKFRVFGIVFTSITLNGTPFGGEKFVNYNNNSTPMGISNLSFVNPGDYKLSQNYPNPFNPATKIRFAIPKSGFVTLTLFDALGREVETLVNEQMQAGTYEADWNAGGHSSGIYFYELKSEGFIETKKMILTR